MTQPSPEPLLPADVDLRGLEYMPYYGDRLRESGLNARVTDAEYRAAHNLWWSAWKQVPAASLPDDDVDLCRLADLGRDQKTWQAVKAGAMRGFVLCTDGRWYHRALSTFALDAWAMRLDASAKGKLGAAKRWGKPKHEKDMPQPPPTDSTGNATAIEKHSKEVKGREEKKPRMPTARRASPDGDSGKKPDDSRKSIFQIAQEEISKLKGK